MCNNYKLIINGEIDEILIARGSHLQLKLLTFW